MSTVQKKQGKTTSSSPLSSSLSSSSYSSSLSFWLSSSPSSSAQAVAAFLLIFDIMAALDDEGFESYHGSMADLCKEIRSLREENQRLSETVVIAAGGK